MWLLRHLYLSVPEVNIALSLITGTVVSTMLGVFPHAQHFQNNIQVVPKASDLDLTIISQPIGISLKGIPSNKSHSMLTLRMTDMVSVIGKLLPLTKERMYTILAEESLSGSMSSIPFNQMN